MNFHFSWFLTKLKEIFHVSHKSDNLLLSLTSLFIEQLLHVTKCKVIP